MKSEPVPAYKSHHLAHCTSCGLHYAARSPSEEELNAIYSAYPAYGSLNPITRKRYLGILDQLEPARQKNALLDAGSGSGFFLDVAMERGWNVSGSEYDPAMVDACRARGIRMWPGALQKDSFETGSIDVITSFEVLEHLLDPIQELGFFHRFLRPGGWLYLTTPNFNSIGRTLAKGNWSIINYPEHLNYFDPRTMRKALKKSGFEVRKLQTTGFSPSRFVNSRHTTIVEENVDPVNTDQRLRNKIEGNKLLQFAKSAVNTTLSLTGTGDTLKVLARRK
jgi:2-polyprenyl-3-methyl-5-hydroxy-6-metoxy-1,4-benzoquinol methylase